MATIALDARLTKQMSVGMKTYVRELVTRLPKVAPDLHFTVISNEDFSSADVSYVRVSERTAKNASWGEQITLSRIARASGANLTHFMSVYAPRWPRVPYVYTIHDLIHRRFPGYFSWKIPLYYALVVGPVARRARVVITDAQATISDLQRYLGVPSARVRVVPLGVAADHAPDQAGRAQRARASWGLDRPFFLYAGNHRRHKNLVTLAAAWQATAGACDLVITEDGPLGFDRDRFAKKNGRILTTGHVERGDLIDLYAACAGVVQPSLYEGFGLSVLEAMSAGAPVVIAQTPALLEVAADAALSFSPLDDQMLATHMMQLLNNPELADTMRARGKARAAEFSWNETARKTADVYREFIG